MADIWQWTPLMFLIFMSGLAALPEDQMNAAQILGADYWFRLRHLILPMMKPIILIALIIRGMEVFKLFDAAWLLTQGGPVTRRRRSPCSCIGRRSSMLAGASPARLRSSS